MVEHPLSKREVVGSNPTGGFCSTRATASSCRATGQQWREKGARNQDQHEITQQFILKYSLWGSNPRPMAHKTIALTTELREPWVSFPSTHISEEAFPRSQYSVPECAKLIARCNRNAPRGQFHSAAVSEERFAAWKNIVWVISSSRERGMFRLGGEGSTHTAHYIR